jgi:ribonucleotide monophosphatase NagD (HAD superfamily)
LSPPFFPEVLGLICVSAFSFRINGRFAGALYR